MVFTDTDLLPFVNAAESRIARLLTDAGAKIFMNDATLTVVAATTQLDWASSPALPDDLIFPLKLWEKAVGDPDSRYIEMDQNDEHVPLADQTITLRYWAWTGIGTNGTAAIALTGATTDRVVKVTYFRQLAALTGATDPLHIPNSKDAIVADVLRRCHLSRGEGDLGNAQEVQFQAALDEIKRLFVKGGQRRPRRRRAYGSTGARF